MPIKGFSSTNGLAAHLENISITSGSPSIWMKQSTEHHSQGHTLDLTVWADLQRSFKTLTQQISENGLKELVDGHLC
jgi:hypothetical protein